MTQEKILRISLYFECLYNLLLQIFILKSVFSQCKLVFIKLQKTTKFKQVQVLFFNYIRYFKKKM